MTDLRDQIQTSIGTAYTIERELGGGGMSRVFVATDTALRREVVVKVLPPELVAGVNVERFRREILLAAGLQHPHIVPVLSAGEMDGVPWFTMPFVQGESLRHRLARGPVAIPEAIEILRDVAKALAYAHERGVVHRDIKPDNVLLSGGAAVVTDFGIAKALSASRSSDNANATRGATLTQIGTSIGTPTYMAPEQAAADPHTDGRADIYSFGCMAYELLAGRPPFVGLSPQRLLAAQMSERPRSVAELRPDAPPLVAELVMHCLEKDPDARPQSAADLERLLELATTTSGSATAASAVLLSGRVRLRVAIGLWAAVFGASWILAKAAIVGIGLPDWVLPGALIVAGLGLPVILFTAFVQRTAHRELTRTPTLTPGGTPAPQGTLATIAFKASPHVTWKRTVRGGVVAFGAFVLLVAAFMVLRAFGIGPAGSLLASGRISNKAPVLITDFSVKGGDSTLAGVVSTGLRASLAQSNVITLVAPQSVTAALAYMQRPANSRVDLSLAREIAQRTGVAAIVDGEVSPLGAGYVVSVRLVSADSGTTLATVQKAADGPTQLIAAIDAAGRELRGKIGESLRSVQSGPPLEQVTTASLDALRKYSEGTRAHDETDYAAAIPALRQAVAVDSTFASAWRKLAVAYLNSNYPQAAVDSALTQAYRWRDRMTPSERLMTTGSYFYRGPGRDRARGAQALQELLSSGEPTAANNLGLIVQGRRQYAKAESLFAIDTGGSAPIQLAYTNLMVANLDAGDFRGALATAAASERRSPSAAARGDVDMTRVAVLAVQRDLPAAEKLDDSLAANGGPDARAGAMTYRSAFAAQHGQTAAFDRRIHDELAFAAARQSPPPPLQYEVEMSEYDVATRDKPAAAIATIDSALAVRPFGAMALIDRRYLDVATVYAQAGRPDRAKAVLAQRAAALHDTSLLRQQLPLYHRALGEIDLADGRPRDAVSEFWKGDSLPDGPVDDCDLCTYQELARAYDKANVPDSAIVYWEKYFASTFYFRAVYPDLYERTPAARRLGELYEAKGDKAHALEYYGMFVDLWKNADPELQPQVAEVKKRIARLSDSENRG
jgi:tetratricopeptide (TPR) repeat protein